QGQERRRVGADAEERRVAERELAGVAEQQVQRQREHTEDPGHDRDVQVIGAREPERQGERDRRREPTADLRHAIRSWRAKRPEGRKSSTRMMMTKPTASR